MMRRTVCVWMLGRASGLALVRSAPGRIRDSKPPLPERPSKSADGDGVASSASGAKGTSSSWWPFRSGASDQNIDIKAAGQGSRGAARSSSDGPKIPTSDGATVLTSTKLEKASNFLKRSRRQPLNPLLVLGKEAAGDANKKKDLASQSDAERIAKIAAKMRRQRTENHADFRISQQVMDQLPADSHHKIANDRNRHHVKFTPEQENDILTAYANTTKFWWLWRIIPKISPERVSKIQMGGNVFFLFSIAAMVTSMVYSYQQEMDLYFMLDPIEQRDYLNVVMSRRMGQVWDVVLQVTDDNDPNGVLHPFEIMELSLERMRQLGWTGVDVETESRRRQEGKPSTFDILYKWYSGGSKEHYPNETQLDDFVEPTAEEAAAKLKKESTEEKPLYTAKPASPAIHRISSSGAARYLFNNDTFDTYNIFFWSCMWVGSTLTAGDYYNDRMLRAFEKKTQDMEAQGKHMRDNLQHKLQTLKDKGSGKGTATATDVSSAADVTPQGSAWLRPLTPTPIASSSS